MAQGARDSTTGETVPRLTMLSGAAGSARHQFSGLWSRESLSRLILSLVLAVGLWVYVTDKQLPGTADFPLPIQVTVASLGPGYSVTNNLPSIRLRYQTDSANIYVSPSSFQASVNLASLGPGTHNRVPVDVLSDPGIKVLSWTPRYVPVVVVRQIAKPVPVVAHYIGRTLASGYVAGAPQFDPATVLVTGPEPVVSEVTQAVVDLHLNGQRSSILSLYPPKPETSRGQIVTGNNHLTLNPSVVQVKIAVRAVASFKTVPILVQPKGVPRAGYGVHAITTNPSAVTITGLPRTLSKITSLKTVPVSVAGRGGGTLRVHARLEVPHTVSSSAHAVTVEIQLTPIDESSNIDIAVTPINVTPGLVANVSPNTVLVTVIGPSSSVAHAARGLTATVNLYGYGTGVYTLTPIAPPVNGLQVAGQYPSTVTVTIAAAHG